MSSFLTFPIPSHRMLAANALIRAIREAHRAAEGNNLGTLTETTKNITCLVPKHHAIKNPPYALLLEDSAYQNYIEETLEAHERDLLSLILKNNLLTPFIYDPQDCTFRRALGISYEQGQICLELTHLCVKKIATKKDCKNAEIDPVFLVEPSGVVNF